MTTQLLIIENILWLPLCRINKFGLNTLPSKAVAIPYTCGLSPGTVGHVHFMGEPEAWHAHDRQLRGEPLCDIHKAAGPELRAGHKFVVRGCGILQQMPLIREVLDQGLFVALVSESVLSFSFISAMELLASESSLVLSEMVTCRFDKVWTVLSLLSFSIAISFFYYSSSSFSFSTLPASSTLAPSLASAPSMASFSLSAWSSVRASSASLCSYFS